MSLKFIVSALALVVLAVVVYDFAKSYLQSPNKGWQRVWDAGRGSATMVAVQLGIVVSMLATSADKMTDWICSMINDPSAAAQIKALIAQYTTPTTVGIGMAIFTGLVFWARMRTLGKS